MRLGIGARGYRVSDMVEIDLHAQQTLSYNHPGAFIHGDIRRLCARDFRCQEPLFAEITYPCDHYSEYGNVHGTQTGDEIFLHALRIAIMLDPRFIILENVLGMRKFKVVMELWRGLPGYYCTEYTVYGHDYTLMRKPRCFLLLHQEPFEFPPIDHFIDTHEIPFPVILKRPGQTLREYMEDPREMDAQSLEDIEIIDSIGTRVSGGYLRQAKLYHPDSTEPINLPTNYKRDRTVSLVADPTSRYGYRPWSSKELARFHGYTDGYKFFGGKCARFRQILDSVMPVVAYTFGYLMDSYFEAIDGLAPRRKAKGHRVVNPGRQNVLGTGPVEESRSRVEITLKDLVQQSLFI
jgi:DNA (cytosine-5)-methyltransferase 1